MNICMKTATVSNRLEMLNNDLKRRYLLTNIEKINIIMKCIPGYCGSFGTGYPFYVLDNNLQGNLPIVEEQIRYDNELYTEAKEIDSWVCDECLKLRGKDMPDLKVFCKPCKQIKDSIKPRKVINRLLDIDMWMICEDDKINSAAEIMSRLFDNNNMHTSDVNPVATINDMEKITTQLENGVMPKEMLPLDIHIISYSEFSNLLDKIVFEIESSAENNRTPYLPIHPISLRKTWQYDDAAYNFVLDYLLSLTPFSWNEELFKKLQKSRKAIREMFGEENLKEILYQVSPESVKRRFKTKALQRSYERRINLWES